MPAIFSITYIIYCALDQIRTKLKRRLPNAHGYGVPNYGQVRIFSRTLPKMVSKPCKYRVSGFFYAIENCVSSCLSALPRVFERMARLRIDSWHGNVLFQGGACTAGDLVERT